MIASRHLVETGVKINAIDWKTDFYRQSQYKKEMVGGVTFLSLVPIFQFTICTVEEWYSNST